jgi:cytidine deaminase
MSKHIYQFEFEIIDDSSFLIEQDKELIKIAREYTAKAYAPYSHFHVAAVARMKNGDLVWATNQENASYPVGLCAERVLLGLLSSSHPDMPINTIAISYYNHGNGKNEEPISPCGLCRQTLIEYEQRMKGPIRFMLSAQTGKILIIKSAKDLLPFNFGSDYLTQ